MTEELTAGTHSFYLFCPTGFDDSSLKSCDIYGWAAYFTKEAAAETTADTDTNVTENAPSTADTAVIAVVALAVSATAAIVVSKKRREF